MTQHATSDASALVAGGTKVTHNQGDVTVVASAATTTVTVKQDAAVTGASVAAVTGVTEVASVKFADLAKDGSVTVGGLTFTAGKALTAAQVAQASANLSATAITPTDLTDQNEVVEAGKAAGDTQVKFGQQHAYRHLPKWATFLPQAAQSLTATGLAQVSTLRLNGVVLAGGLSYLHKKRRYFYLFDYDPAFVRFSPAKILLRNLIEQTFHEGGVFCFGAGSAAYKRDWGPAVGELKAALVFLHPAARAALQEQLTPSGLSVLGRV